MVTYCVCIPCDVIARQILTQHSECGQIGLKKNLFVKGAAELPLDLRILLASYGHRLCPKVVKKLIEFIKRPNQGGRLK